MPTITVKYSEGDTVYHAGSSYSQTKTMECPDCLGTKIWTVRFADGNEAECDCQTCSHALLGPRGSIIYHEYTPNVTRLTIGQVGLDNNGPRYMCRETGIGSGTVYREKDLFETEDEAKAAADEKYKDQMKQIAKNNFSKQGDFAQSLSTFGFTRREAIKEDIKMRKWLEIIDTP